MTATQCTHGTGRGGAEIDFFARMAASISHELKNVLAIINENAGLLEDLLLMAEKGRPLSPERLQRLANHIKGQIDRGDAIVGRLNRFAHTVYDPVAATDLQAMCELVAALTARLAAMQNVRVMAVADQQIAAEVHPFFLANALWLLLKHIFQLTQGNTVVQLRPNFADGCPCIDVQVEGEPVEVLEQASQEAGKEGREILAAVHGGFVIQESTRVICFRLGAKM